MLNIYSIHTNIFRPIHLDDMDQVQLMNRIDKKYWFNAQDLNELMNSVQDDYFILNIEGEHVQDYKTTYYDTMDNDMFSQHHNGKLNRYKVRRRSYILSNMSFLEVKFKNNKRKTFKYRIPTRYDQVKFTEQERVFLDNLIPYYHNQLIPTISNRFSRITLVNKNYNERCTLDFNLSFETDDKEILLRELAIIEIKTDGRSVVSPLALALRDARIKSTGFSKYCIGCTLTNQDIKRNNFKRKIRRIEKLIRSNSDLFN